MPCQKEYNTIQLKENGDLKIITFNRLSNKNSINYKLLQELNDALNQVESDVTCKLVVLEGQKGIFCTGMDFEEFNQFSSDRNINSSLLMETLKRFSLSKKVIISKIDGQVMAGGIGIVAASDLVVATPNSQFSLSEAIWGLLPACVAPYLIRRVGFQKAYAMTLTTMPISAIEAHRIHLVDEVDENPNEIIRKYFLRLRRLKDHTIRNMKQYFRKMWLITEEMENIAVAEIQRLSSQPEVRKNIDNFVKFKKFPWDD